MLMGVMKQKALFVGLLGGFRRTPVNERAVVSA
jgi:hypothetical protein